MTMYDRMQIELEKKNTNFSTMAKDLGFSSGLPSQWKSGMQKPSMPKVRLIADYLNVSVDYLLTGNISVILNEDEKHLIDVYRECIREHQNDIIIFAETAWDNPELLRTNSSEPYVTERDGAADFEAYEKKQAALEKAAAEKEISPQLELKKVEREMLEAFRMLTPEDQLKFIGRAQGWYEMYPPELKERLSG